MRIKILFLVSGNGGTLKFVHHAMKTLNLDAEIVAAISDRECGAIDFSCKIMIPCHIFKPWKEKLHEITEEIIKYSPDIVVTNIHKILPIEIITCCNAKFVNLHYSLLPAFGGVVGFKTLELAKEANTKIIGATCHFVTEDLDGGDVISQAAIPVDWNDSFNEISNKVFRIACESILNGILILSDTMIGESEQDGVIYSPKLRFNKAIFSDSFWNMISKI